MGAVRKLAWHRPRITTVMTTGPLRCCVLVYGQIVFRTIPIVINSGEEKLKAQRKADANKGNYKRVKKCRAKKKQKDPVTIPKELFRKLDDAAFKKLEDNHRDAKPITYEQAWALALADMVADMVAQNK
jgi:hypothetical protein